MPQVIPADRNPLRYRTDIDGLRALAVLAVVSYHGFPAALTGGFVGVDVFFVISGYLISGIIFSSLDRGQFSFMTFYGRRIRRIFPALFLVLLICLSYGFVVLLPTELAALGKDTAGGAGFISNIMLWNESGYFDRAAVSKPLLHLWSLGVEEQFYIIWPLALWGLWRTRLNRLAVFATVFLASFYLNCKLASEDVTFDFYSPLTRFWELSFGAMLAWLSLHPSSSLEEILRRFEGKRQSLRNMASIIGLALIIGGALLLDQQMRFPGALALLPTSGAVLLIAAGPSAVVNRVVLSNRIAVFIGLISYPLYLWHWPLISYAHILQFGRAPKPLAALGLIAISFLLAWLTYRLAERPIRFGNNLRSKTIALVVLTGLVGIAGTSTWLANGFASRYPGLPYIDITKINAAAGDGIFKHTRDMRVQEIQKNYISQIGGGNNGVLFIGDSLLYHYGPRVQELFAVGRLKSTVYFVVGPSCAPFPGIIKPGIFANCSNISKISDDLIATKNIKTIIIGCSWQGYHGDNVYVERSGVRMPINKPQAFDNFYANLEDYVKNLVQTNHKVYLILSVPTNARFDPKRMISRSLTGFKIDPDVLKGVQVSELTAATAETNQRLIAIAEKTGAMTMNPLSDICGIGVTCTSFFADGEPKFADSMHLRPIFVKDNITFFDDILTH